VEKNKKHMRKITLPLLCFAGVIAFGQRKSDLLNQIERLRSEKDSVVQELAASNRKISTAEAQAETYQSENTSLRDANATLLKNLSNFSELSKRNTQNVNNALLSLEKKEKQLSGITDAISTNDSISIVQAPLIQQKLGDEAKVGLAGSSITVAYKLDALFETEMSDVISENGTALLVKVAEVIRENDSRTVLIQGLNITGEFDTTWKQAIAVASALSSTHGIASNTLTITAMDGNFSEGITIVLQPNYKKFYVSVKEQMRN
jgi:hypothetical protein